MFSEFIEVNFDSALRKERVGYYNEVLRTNRTHLVLFCATMILLIDNYDSFVYNLHRYLVRLGQEIEVVRNDQVDMLAIEAGKYQAIVISPGPKAPDQAGQCIEVVRRFSHAVPILGICLGHQVIWQAFGGRIVRANRPMHGRTSAILWRPPSRLFEGIPTPFFAARYHSLVGDPATAPNDLIVTAWTEDGVIMAFEHRSACVFGLQFHPESILTDVGYSLLANFLSAAGLLSPDSGFEIPASDLKGSPLQKAPMEVAAATEEEPAIAVMPGMPW